MERAGDGLAWFEPIISGRELVSWVKIYCFFNLVYRLNYVNQVISMHECTCACMRVSVCTRVKNNRLCTIYRFLGRACMHLCILYVYACVYTLLFKLLRVYTCIHTFMCMLVYIHTDLHTCTCACTYRVACVRAYSAHCACDFLYFIFSL